MKDILPWLFWGVGGAVSGLASADLLLLDRQKKWINDRAADFWNWLDDQRELKYLRYLRGFRWQRFVVILYAIIALIVTVGIVVLICMGAFDDPEFKAKAPRNFQYLLLGAYTGGFLTALLMVRIVLPSVLNWVTKTEGSWAYIGRSTVAAVATIAFYYATNVVVSLWMDNPIIDPANPDSFAKAFSFSHPITAAIAGAYGMFMCTVALVMLMSWVLVVLPVIFVLLLTIMFRAAQFVAVRVAENPKAPQYVLSALLVAIGCARHLSLLLPRIGLRIQAYAPSLAPSLAMSRWTITLSMMP